MRHGRHECIRPVCRKCTLKKHRKFSKENKTKSVWLAYIQPKTNTMNSHAVDWNLISSQHLNDNATGSGSDSGMHNSHKMLNDTHKPLQYTISRLNLILTVFGGTECCLSREGSRVWPQNIAHSRLDTKPISCINCTVKPELTFTSFSKLTAIFPTHYIAISYTIQQENHQWTNHSVTTGQ